MKIFRRGNRKPQATRPKRDLPWVIKLSGRLLALQSLGLFALAIYTQPNPPIAAHLLQEIWPTGFYLALAFLSAIAALGLLRLRPLAWDLAMLIEGAALLQAVTQYWIARPFYIYLQMLYGIFTVIYLNRPELRSNLPTELIESQTETRESHQI